MLLWIAFGIFIILVLVLDVGVFHRPAHEVKTKEAALWNLIWIFLAVLFGLGIYRLKGTMAAEEYLTAYILEKSLSIDNIFIFILIFRVLEIPRVFQHKILFWGVVGALVLRGIFIRLGIYLLTQGPWIFFLFGLLLIFSALKMFTGRAKRPRVRSGLFKRLPERILPVIPNISSGRFFLVRYGRIYATPLLVALLMIESADLIFATDSIPAVLAVTKTPFIMYTSNIFAVLGLRSLFFTLGPAIQKLHYFRRGSAVILIFVGLKMMLHGFYEVPKIVTLGFVVLILCLVVGASLLRRKRRGKPRKFVGAWKPLLQK